MLWKAILALLTLFGDYKHGKKSFPGNGLIHQGESWGPQTPAEELEAFEALYNDHEGGDMIIPRGELVGNGVVSERYRWSGYPGSGKIPYVIDPSIESEHHEVIMDAMDQFSSQTCVQFKRRKQEQDYIRFVKEKGCWAHVGKQGGEQKVSLGDGCYYVGTVVHELGHAIGFMHEHQRSDRDRYLNVFPRNTKSGYSQQLEKSRSNSNKIFTDFDYESIMIYGNYAFSKSPSQLPTMEAKNGAQLSDPYHKSGLSQSDVQRVNTMYKC